MNSHLSRISGRVDFVGGHPVLAYKAFFGFIGKPSVELPITDVAIYSDKGRFRIIFSYPEPSTHRLLYLKVNHQVKKINRNHNGNEAGNIKTRYLNSESIVFTQIANIIFGYVSFWKRNWFVFTNLKEINLCSVILSVWLIWKNHIQEQGNNQSLVHQCPPNTMAWSCYQDFDTGYDLQDPVIITI